MGISRSKTIKAHFDQFHFHVLALLIISRRLKHRCFTSSQNTSMIKYPNMVTTMKIDSHVQDALLEVAELNCSGIELLNEGKVRDAARAFAVGLHALHRVDVTGLENFTFKSENCFSIELPYLQDEYLYMYNHAIGVRPCSLTFQKLRTPTTSNISLFMAMITFNLSLTYHIEGIRKENINAFAKAFKLYETTKSLLLDSSSSHENALLTATLNNQACIHYSREEYDLCRMDLTELVQCQTMDCQWGSIVDDKHIEEFLLNTVVMVPKSGAPCA